MFRPQRGDVTLSVVQADPGTEGQVWKPFTVPDAKRSAAGEAGLVLVKGKTGKQRDGWEQDEQ